MGAFWTGQAYPAPQRQQEPSALPSVTPPAQELFVSSMMACIFLLGRKLMVLSTLWEEEAGHKEIYDFPMPQDPELKIQVL